MISGVHQSRVQRAVRAVRREFFLPPDQRSQAHVDAPLPIGHEQTISQPSLVVRMTETLAPTERDRVLEIGTGSGFQTALLAELAAEVFTVERIPELAAAARQRLLGLGYRNIHYRCGEGALGWPEAAPFDGIMVTAAAPLIPPAWLEQLRPGGRMVVPLGRQRDATQRLVLVTKAGDGAIHEQELCPVRFVPLISEATPE